VRREHRAQVGRFILLGGTNTLLTFALFTGLQHVTSVAAAYTIAFAAGLVFSTALTGRFVFRVEASRPRRLVFAGAYAVIYLIGLGVSHLLAREFTEWLVSAGTIAVTAPLGFLAGRTVLAHPGPARSAISRSDAPD
jgi:putative flippase GtrA